MAVLKEWRCKAHGAFEAAVPQGEIAECPHGCPKRFISREIRTAPSARGPVMGTLDHMQRELAHDFGLSDLKAGRDDGKSVMQNLREGNMMAPTWIDVPGHLKPGFTQRKEAAAAVNVAGTYGVTPDNVLSTVAPPKSIPTNIVAATQERMV